MTDEGQDFLHALHEWLAPILGSATAAGIGYFAGHKKTQAEISRIEAERDAAGLDAVTRSFQALIAGYETRIEDLTREVESLRDEVRELRQALDRRPRPST